ncbi:LysR family transcriptional regulator [Paraburkholderia metrosideri]|nr:LysR family transcriptional regulator [Paraburkholderia metrosideri]
MMKLNQLRTFIAVVESKSIHRGASALGISQPAVSMTLRDLEEIFGGPLLVRKTKGVEVTALGALLHQRGRAILADLDRINEEMASLQNRRGGMVSIAVSSAIVFTVLPYALRQFREKMPSVQVRITEISGRDALIDGLAGGKFDFATILTAPYFFPLPDDIERLAEVDLPLIVGARAPHPLVHAKSLSELIDAEWLIPFEGSDSVELSLKNDFSRFGLKVPARPVHCDNVATALEIFGKMDFIGVFTKKFADIQFERYNLVQIKIRETLPVLQAGMFQRQQYIQTEAAEYFIECFRANM